MFLELRLTLLSDYGLSALPTDSDGGSEDRIPGSALRGAAASLYLRTGDAADDLFIALFHDSVVWPDILPGDAARPAPLTAVTCGRFPGLLGGNDAEPPHGVDDLLLVTEAVRLSGDDRLLVERQRCPRCQRQRHAVPTRAYQELVERREAGRYAAVYVARRTVSGAVISPATGLADPDRWYHRPVLAAPTQLRGVITVTDQHAADYLERALLPTGREFRIGAGRSRGLGLVRVDACHPVEETGMPTLAERLDMMNARLAAISPTVRDDAAGFGYVSMMCDTHAIVMDPFFRYQTALTRDDLSVPALELRQFFGATTVVGGWNATAGLPKERAVAIRRGSVALFRYPLPQRAQVCDDLARVARDGVGERRAEGFGRVRINDPFHWEVRQLWPNL